jgi:(hydroxyamino)benzene mutase
MDAIARRLAFHAALLMLVGLLTGGAVGFAMMDQLPVDARMMLGAHLNGLIGGLWLCAVAWSLKFSTLSEERASGMAWLFIGSVWANWAVTAAKSIPAVHGVGINDDPVNNAVFGVLTLTVVLPALAACGLWAWGLRPR